MDGFQGMWWYEATGNGKTIRFRGKVNAMFQSVRIQGPAKAYGYTYTLDGNRVMTRVAHPKRPLLMDIGRLVESMYADSEYLGMNRSKTADALARLILSLHSMIRDGGAKEENYLGLSVLSYESIQPIITGLRHCKLKPDQAIANLSALNQLYRQFCENQ